MNNNRHRVTQVEVARQAGVTQGVVSSVFSNPPLTSISDETRERVLSIAAKLGYAPKRKSGSETAGKTVLYVTNPSSTLIYKGTDLEEKAIIGEYDSFFAVITDSLSMRTQEKGLELALHSFRSRSQLMDRLNKNDICAVVWRKPVDDPSLFKWVSSRFPTVYLGMDSPNGQVYDLVSVDQEKNILIAAEHLWSMGHRRIAYYGCDPAIPMKVARKTTYLQFMQAKGLPPSEAILNIPDLFSVPSKEKAINILDVWQKLGSSAPTALITNTIFIFSILSEARNRQIDIPKDLSLLGVDNTPACSLLHPPLTVVDQCFPEIGHAAVDLLTRRMAERDAPMRHIKVLPELIVRQSVADLRHSLPT